MDHVWALFGRNSCLAAVPHFTVVPLICTGWTCHRGVFESLSRHYGLETVDSLLSLRKSQPERFQWIVQSWLYFDLLKNFFPDDFRLEDFVKGTPDRSIVSSQALIQYCSGSTQQLKINHREKHRVLQFATSLVNRLDDWNSEESSSDAQCQRASYERPVGRQSQLIICSAKILIETLWSLLQKFCPAICKDVSTTSTSLAGWVDKHFTTYFYPGNVRPNGNQATTQESNRVSFENQSMRPAAAVYLIEFLRQDKQWCPNRLNRMNHQLDSTCLYLFAIMDHDTAINRQGYGEFSQTYYKKNDLSIGEYKTKHSARCHSDECGLISVAGEDLDTIYQESSKSTTVPILKCTADGGVQVQKSGSHEYYAISHVWSEGLGNKDANAIYRCQLRDIMEQVRQTRQSQHYTDQAPNSLAHAQDPVYIWLDTLCVPPSNNVRGASAMSSKKLAIQRMDWIFAAATSVVIREASLQNEGVDFFNISRLQQAMYLYNMTWLTRCWTLAEAVAAWELHLSIKGRSLNLHELIESVKSAEDDALQHEAAPSERADVEQGLSPIRNLRKCILDSTIACLLNPFEAFGNGKAGRMDLSWTWNALLDRSTTKSEDIPGILAVANALSPKEINVHAAGDRIKAVLNSFKELPTGFLFNVGPKFDNEGDNPRNRWVPAELSVSACRITGSEMLQLYQEGRLAGPLDADTFPTYFFKGKVLESFDLQICHPGDLRFQRLNIKMKMPSRRAKDITEWCMVLPSSFIFDGFYKTSSCIAFCAEVLRGSEMTPKVLVRWETLAEVSITLNQQMCNEQRPQTAPKALQKSKVYIACDTSVWPSSLALRQYYSLIQEHQIFQLRGRIITLLYLLSTVVCVCAFLSVLLTVGPLPAVMPILGGVLVVWSMRLTRSMNKDSVPNTEAKVRTHEGWRQLFLASKDRAASSYLFRYLQLLRSLQSQLDFIRINKPIVVLELVSCSIGVCMATYLLFSFPKHRWFIAPAIVAWLAFFGLPVYWAHRLNGPPGRLALDFTAIVPVASGAGLSLAPNFAYSDLQGTLIMCSILFGLMILHMVLILLRQIVDNNCAATDQAQKNHATLEQLFTIGEYGESSTWKLIWGSLRLAAL